MKEKLRAIIAEAIHAPSGDNIQPWYFHITDDTIEIFNIPERDNSLYGWGQRASFIAHGALIENIIVTATQHDIAFSVSLFPDDTQDSLVARLTANKSKTKTSPLISCIKKRATNRKPYAKMRIADEMRDAVLQCTQHAIVHASLFLTDQKEKIDIIAKAVAANERILFENQHMHSFFFGHIAFSIAEHKKRKYGFPLHALEVPKALFPIFRLMRSWKRMRWLNKINMGSAIAKNNATLYASSGLMCAVSVDDDMEKNFIDAGRLLQRIWLTVTAYGLALQPLTGICLLALRIRHGATNELSKEHIGIVENAYHQLHTQFQVPNDKNLAFVMRIGKADPPTAKTLRATPTTTEA